MTRAIALVAVLGMATVAFALPVQWSPVVNGVIEVDQLAGAVVQLKSAGAGSVGGMDLFITVPDAVSLSEGTTIGLAGGLYDATNTAGENIDFSETSGGFRHGQMYTFANKSVDAAPGVVLAQFKVSVDAGTPIGTEYRMENSWDGGPGAIGGDMPIVDVVLRVVPEPASALLVLAGLPLLRRRRA